MTVYLDWNATTPPLPAAVDAMMEAAHEAWGNPSSVHATGRRARGRVEDARGAVAELLGVDPRDVVFTSSGTEANNLALRAPFAAAPGTLVTSRLEHPSVTRVAEALEREGRARVAWLRVRPDGRVDLEDLERAVSMPDVRLLALQAVNHETGVVQPVQEALALCRARGVLMHADAVQALGRVAIAGAAPDTRAIASHKIRGPKGIGALVLRPGLRVAPVLHGGGQERGIRPGTVDPVACAGFAAALRHASTGPARYAALAPLRDALEHRLRAMGADLHGAAAPRAPHVSNAAFPGWEGPELAAALDLEGVCVSSGSACSAGTAEPSPVLTAMLGEAAARAAVRVSLGEATREDEIERALEAFQRILRRGRGAT